MKLPIPQAMAWKYPGAKCSKTPDGQDINIWIHPTIPRPSKAQVAIDVQEYEIWKASDDATKAQATIDIDTELNLPGGNAFKILKDLRTLGKI